MAERNAMKGAVQFGMYRGGRRERRIALHKSQLALHLEAITNAVRDAGLKITDVDGIFTAGQHSPALLGEALGITPRYVDGTSVGGCSFMILVEHAVAALHHHLCNVAVVSHGESGRSGVGVTGAAIRASVASMKSVRFGAAPVLWLDYHPPHARIWHNAGAMGPGGSVHTRLGGAESESHVS